MLLKSVRQKNWGMLLCAAFFILHSSLLTSCRQEDDRTEIVAARHWVEKTVAVVAPIGDAATKARLERTADWFLDNFREAQMHDTLAIDLKIAWYDELSADLAELSTRLASDSTVVAVIGPFSNEGVAEFAPACMKTQKPLIAPTATSEDVIRRYAVTTSGQKTNTTPFLWSLTETDVNFAGLLMSGFATESQYRDIQYKDFIDELGAPMCGVFSPDDAYGMTFNYWAPFYAQQDGITLQRNQQYGSTAELLSLLGEYRPVMRESPLLRSAIFCAVETAQQMYDVVRDNRKAMLDDPELANMLPSTDPDDPANDQFWQLFNASYQTYFAFSGLSEDALTALGPRGTKILQGTEGFSPYADPGTGFELSYKTRFSQLPTFAECKFYDALMLAAFAANYIEHSPLTIDHSSTSSTGAANNGQWSMVNGQFNAAIIAITSGSAAAPMGGSAWDATAMEIYLSALERGQLLHFIGASGEIAFDRDTYTAATTTTYVRWQIIDDQIVHRQYFGTTGGRTTDANAAWLYLYNEQQADADFRQQASGGTDHHFVYPALTDQYAVLVQGSDGFINYRHQADVLSVYQALRLGGFDDDHIILITDATMAAQSRNPEPCTVRNAPGGPDLLGGTDQLPKAVVDYDSRDLSARDIADILMGRASSRLPVVLPQGEGHNVLFFWSGHGSSQSQGGADEFVWRDTRAGQGFTAELLRQTAEQMQFRKLCIAAEPCYGECVIRAVEGIPGVLAMSGASAAEQSWADHWNNDARIWMCDRFSLNLVTCLTDNPQSSFRDIFLYCAQHTLGSHAKIVNADHYGNLFTTGPAEFIRYDNK
jgi:glycosylphosphatidylinositol transamidase (GPIT) subunit GPI8